MVGRRAEFRPRPDPGRTVVAPRTIALRPAGGDLVIGMINDPVLRVDAASGSPTSMVRGGRLAGPRRLIVWGESSVASTAGRPVDLLAGIEATVTGRPGAQSSSTRTRACTAAVQVAGARRAGGAVGRPYNKDPAGAVRRVIPFRSALSWLTRISKESPVKNGARKRLRNVATGDRARRDSRFTIRPPA